MAIPAKWLGKYDGLALDPNATPFLKSIGYSDEIAGQYGGNMTNIAFSDNGDGTYTLNISQPALSRSQNIPFTLNEEKVTPLKDGKSMKSLFKWVEGSNTLKCEYSNTDNIAWNINYGFENDKVTMVRDSPTVHTHSEFKKV